MHFRDVKSSNIEAIGHEGDTLAVRFKGGKVYHYAGVSAEEFDGLCGAESCGSHFAKNIRAKYKGVLQDPEE